MPDQQPTPEEMNARVDLMQIASVQAVQGEKIKSIEETCATIKTYLIGNGKPGLVVRTDRLEQRDATRSKFFWLLITAVVGLAVKAMWPDVVALLSS